jgi:hypothetical protein
MSYPRKSLGHILQALRDWGIPETIAGSVTVGMFDGDQNKRDRIFYGNQLLAEYKYFEGIEQPLFRWHMHQESYGAQPLEVQEDGSLKPKFRLSIGPHGNASLIFNGHEATPQLYQFLCGECLVNYTNMPGYKLTQDSGAFFQGGSGRPDGGWFYIEFWEPKGAQAFVDFVNENYKPPK